MMNIQCSDKEKIVFYVAVICRIQYTQYVFFVISKPTGPRAIFFENMCKKCARLIDIRYFVESKSDRYTAPYRLSASIAQRRIFA